MGINKYNRQVGQIYYKGRPILNIHKNARLVWSSDDIIKSCFYNETWLDNYIWTDDYPWNK